jgi:hypothetical protein
MMTLAEAANYGTLAGAFAIGFYMKWNASRQNKKLNEIHTLVNSDMSRQLRTVMIMSQRLASASKDPEDIRVAEQAKKDFDDHQAKQDVVDKGNAN